MENALLQNKFRSRILDDAEAARLAQSLRDLATLPAQTVENPSQP